MNLRKEVNKILLSIISKLIELTGEFKDESNLDNIIKEIEKDDAKGLKDK